MPVGLEVDLNQAIEVFREATLSVEDVLAEPPPDVLPWEFSQNNVNIRVRWWTKPQRTFEVRTRAAVVVAIKRDSEAAGIALPADAKISFAGTPLLVEQTKVAKGKTPAKEKPKEPPAKSAAPSEQQRKPADEKLDPEAEKPKLGELNEGADQVPR